MKTICKRLAAAMALTAAMGISGCGDSTPEPKKDTEPEKQKTALPGTAPQQKKFVRKTFADSEEGSFKVRYPNGEPKKPQSAVRDSGTNVNILKKDDPAAAGEQVKISKKEQLQRDEFRTKRPKDSFAAKLEPLNSGKVIRWSPMWHSDIASGIRLPAVAINPDRTIIIIAETLGESRGPFGTRLVFLDTCSWTISAVHHLWKNDIISIAVALDHTLVLASRGQAAFKSSDEIILLDPWSGRAKQVLPLPGVRKLYVDPAGQLFAVFARESEKSDRIALFPSLLKKGLRTMKEIKSANHAPVLAFSRDGSKFAAAGDKAVEIFRGSDLRVVESTPLPEGFIAADLLMVADTAIAAPESRLQRPAAAFRDGWKQEFGENSRGMLVCMPDAPDQFFGAVMARKGRISRIALATLKEQSGVDPEAGRPRTTGDPKAVFSFAKIKATAVLDERGCFYLLYRDLSGKRWHKEILINSTAAK